MTIARRLSGSFGASILGPAVTIFIQLINVPIMLRVWGPQLYGEWLLVSTIPAYLLLTDLGFGNVAGNDMTIRASSGDRHGAIETFQSISLFVISLSALLGCLLSLAILLAPIHQLLHLSSMTASETTSTLFLLSLNCLVMLHWSVLVAAFRCDGKYALGILTVNLIRIVEGLSFLCLLLFHAGPVQLAGLMLSVSLLGTACLLILKRRLVPWLHFGTRHATWDRIKALAKPALAFLAFPTGNALSLQGTTIVVGAVFGPLAVAVFNPLRTLSRTIYQLTDSVKNAVWPELSAAFGRQDWPLARRLHRLSCQTSLGLAFCAAVFLAALGPHIFQIWTRGRVVMDLPAFYILLAVAMANSGWNASSAVSLAANRHQLLALLYVACTSSTLVLAYVLTRSLGLPGTALSLLICDFTMSIFVVKMSNRLVSEQWRPFAISLLTFSELASIRGRLARFFS